MLGSGDSIRGRRSALMVLAVLTCLTCLSTGRPAAAEPVVISSTFDTGVDGWTVYGDGSGPTWVSTGGVEGGYISSTDQGQGVYWYVRAPAKFLGNKSTAYGQDLTFQLKQSATDSQGASQPDVVLIGGGLTLVYDAPANPGTSWTPYTVRLDESGGWVKSSLGGTAATASEVQNVLENLTEIRIRGEFRSGADTGGLDSVTMTLSEVPVTAVPVTSTFDAGNEGWTVSGDAQGSSVTPTYQSTGGNPGGHISATDDVAGGVWYWRAPVKFLGNLSNAYGKVLSFDLKQSSLAGQFDSIDIILTGGHAKLVFDTANNPGLDWTRYDIPLHESAGWRLDTLSGPAATETDIRGTLSYLLDLHIRGEYVGGADTGGLDNVVLGGTPNLWGDANGNGVVEWSDVAAALGAGGGLRSDGYLERGDVAPRGESGFGDGFLDRLDAIRIARFLGGLEPDWP